MAFLPYMLEGLVNTFILVAGGLLIGFLIGLPLALAQVYGPPEAKTFLDVYVWFFRGVPLLVLLFLFFWGVLPSVGLDLPALETGALVIGLVGGAYESQIFRGAIMSIDEGQMMAARSMGMGKVSAIFRVIVPQAPQDSHTGMV